MSQKSKLESRKIRHRSLRKRIQGTPERPRLVVFRSARHIYAQVIDDLGRKTLVAASDLLKKEAAAAAGKGRKGPRRRTGPRKWARRSRSCAWRRASPRWYSTGRATSTTAEFRRWRRGPARAACSSRPSVK